MQSARPPGERGTSRASRSPTDMAFRDEVEAVCARRDALRTELERVTDAEERAELTQELEALVARIDEVRRKTALTVLADLRQATPCPASWEGMVGDDTVRHCALCEKNVYDFSGLTALEAAQLLHDREGDVCARLHRRRDGRLILADCEVGRRRRRRRVLAGAAASLVLGGAAALLSSGEDPVPVPRLAPVAASTELEEMVFVEPVYPVWRYSPDPETGNQPPEELPPPLRRREFDPLYDPCFLGYRPECAPDLVE